MYTRILSRRDLIGRARAHYLGRNHTVRWSALVALSVVVCTSAVLLLPSTTAKTRVAIRVPCEQPAACAFAESLAVDVWSEERAPGLPLDVVVMNDALHRLDAAGVAWQMLVPDIDAVAKAEWDRLHDPAVARPADWFGEYRDFGAISAHLRELAELAPDRASLQAIGGSVEGRPLWALRIRGHAANPKRMLIDGTQHAREWIAAMVTTCVADRLVRGYDRDPAIRAFVDRTDLWVVPVVNPDGYQHSWAGNRYWRKNRRNRIGVDLNRNFSVAWGGAGSSRFERSETYRGEYAFSEPESSALRDLAKREHIALHVDFHAYGQLVLYPWNYTSTPTKDRDRFRAVGDRIASAMFAAHETRYALINGIELYAAAGTMTDWMYGEADAMSFTIELRPKGGSGFVLPPEQIRPTCDEGLAAVLALRSAQPD
ncbi:MAG: putative carboxypeptidase [Myxococcales bacterium]|nr:putative carboxypeptidase [Myxococcales bacterium]